ncbi:unnamed protein product [Caenorhabditis brenneri]
MPASLIDMPDIVMNRILKELDFRAIMTLRKVNHAIRDFIDNNKPDGKFIYLDIALQTTKAILRYSDLPAGNNSYICTENKNGFRAEFLGKTIQMSGIFHENMLESLKFILEFQKSCLESFGVQGKSNCLGTIYNEFLDGISKILEPINLKTKHFFIQSTDPLPILKNLDPQFLKSIHILDPFGMTEETSSIDLGEILQLEVWKKLETVRIQNCAVENGVIRDFLKFNVVLVMFHTITEFQLKEIFEAFLNPSSTLREFRLEYLFLDDDVECFGEPFTQEYHESVRWYFEIPESTEILLILSKSEAHEYFLFERIDRRSVPEGALIRRS